MALTEDQRARRAKVYMVAGAVTFAVGFLCMIASLSVGDLGGPASLAVGLKVAGYSLMGLGGMAYVASGWIRGGGP